MSQHHATVFATKNIFRATYDDCRATDSSYSATKNFIHTIKQLLHQYHKILAFCNIKGDLASSFSLNIACSQYSVKETHNTKNTLTLTFIRKNKCRSTMRQCLRQKTFVARHMTIVERQNHYIVRRKILSIR